MKEEEEEESINYVAALPYRVITLFDNYVLYLRPLLHLAHEQSLELLGSSSGKRYLSDKVMTPHYAVPVTDTLARL